MWLVITLLLIGCSLAPAEVTERPTALAASPAATVLPSVAATAAPTAALAATAAPTSAPSPTPTAEPTLAPTAEPTPDPVAGLTIADLRARDFGDGVIEIGAVYRRGGGYTSYRISYPADGLRLTGLLHVPDGDGPFPVIIANRGHIDRERYQPGMDSRAFSEYFAPRGYLIVAPDYRGYAGGDAGPNPFYTGYYMDILALIPLAQALPMARPGKVGMWGHSRGASITIVAAAISDQIAAAVVYAPAPADLAADYERRRRQSNNQPGDDTWPFPPAQNPEAYERVSPINYLDGVTAPVLLHHGTADMVVDSSASVAIADALRAAGKHVTLHLYEGGPHTLSGRQERLYFERTLEFFRKHLG
ncbi:MAG TPA: alpha/beta fold hydrolase [Roseiflexaceae bacterium]|nr:alpha/beta fold hydrolase [Roseiflexaceae bacterium]